jgi:hypothetical protein
MITHGFRAPVPRARTITILAVAAAAGCGRPGQAGEVAGAGTCELVHVATSAANAEFSRIAGLAVDSRGIVHVADVGVMEIVTLAEDGRVLYRRGRAGRGPGEFGDLSSIQATPGDSVLVLDGQQNRLSFFPPDAPHPARTLNLSQASSFPPPFGVARRRDGSLLVEYRQYYRGDDDPSEDAARRRVFRVLTHDGTLLRDSLLVLPEPETDVIVRSGGIGWSMPSPFGRAAPWALGAGDEIVYGWGDSLAVEVFSGTGERAGGFVHPHRPVQLSTADLGALTDGRREPFRSALRSAAPATWPAFQQLLVDDGGRVWLGVLGSLDEPTRWHIFQRDGRLVCSAALPRSVRPHQVRGGRMYAVTPDDDDVPHVVVYAVGHSPEAP